MSTISEVKIKGNLKSVIAEGNLFKIIVDKIKSLPDFINHKNSVELYEWVLQIIEENVKPNLNIDKIQLAKKALHAVYNYQPQELQSLENQLTYLVKNNIIKKLPVSSKVYNYLKGVVKKNLSI